MSLGKGLTVELQREEVDGNVYMDTPGLADVELREAAARAISRALKQDGWYKLFFVITLEAGRIRPQDQTTLKLVLTAAPEIQENYGVIITKVTARAKQKVLEG